MNEHSLWLNNNKVSISSTLPIIRANEEEKIHKKLKHMDNPTYFMVHFHSTSEIT